MAPRAAGKKRVSVQKKTVPIAESGNMSRKVMTHFKDIMIHAKYDWINPRDCVPFVKCRANVESGIRRLMAIFDGKFKGESSNGGGISCGTGTPMVVPLTGSLLQYVYKHFKSEGFSEKEVKERVAERSVWYGIVDGGQSHEALIRLMDKYKSWEDYEWYVTLVPSGYTLERYRQLARLQNERHDSKFFVEITFYDMISNMRIEYERLLQIKHRVSGVDVANEYIGYSLTDKKFSTIVQTANTVIRLPKSVLEAIGEITNAEHPELAISNCRINTHGVKTIEEMMDRYDCRIFRHFIHITSLKSAKTFMNAKDRNGERAQLCTIHRAKDLYSQNNFTKAIKPEQITKQYELSVYAIEEEQKFLEFISPDGWPTEMNSIRTNLLQTTLLDVEIEANRGKVQLLGSLSNSYKRHFPVKFAMKKTLSGKQNNRTGKDQPSTPSMSNADNTKTTNKNLCNEFGERSKPGKVERDKSDNNNRTEDEQGDADISELPNTNSLEKEVNETNNNRNEAPIKKEDVQDPLVERGISCHNMRWQDYMNEIWTSKSAQVDAIITEPPEAPSRSFLVQTSRKKTSVNLKEELPHKEALEAAKFGRRILKPGGYFIVLVPIDLFQEWYEALVFNGYNVLPKLVTFSYDPLTIPTRTDSDFPYGKEEHCVVARVPGQHPENFNPNYGCQFNMINCKSTRRSTVVTNIAAPKNRLCVPNSRAPFRMSEKPIPLLSEMVDLWVPPYGTVLDMYAGTLTLPIACIQTSRRCIALEKDKACFKSAVNRLISVCSPKFTMVPNPYSNRTTNVIDYGQVEDETEANDLNSTQSGDNDTKKMVEININASKIRSVDVESATAQFNCPTIIQEETSKDMEYDKSQVTESIDLDRKSLRFGKEEASADISLGEPSTKRIKLNSVAKCDSFMAGKALLKLKHKPVSGCSKNDNRK